MAEPLTDAPTPLLVAVRKLTGGSHELAARLGVHPSMIYLWASGKRPIPSYRIAAMEKVVQDMYEDAATAIGGGRSSGLAAAPLCSRCGCPDPCGCVNKRTYTRAFTLDIRDYESTKIAPYRPPVAPVQVVTARAPVVESECMRMARALDAADPHPVSWTCTHGPHDSADDRGPLPRGMVARRRLVLHSPFNGPRFVAANW